MNWGHLCTKCGYKWASLFCKENLCSSTSQYCPVCSGEWLGFKGGTAGWHYVNNDKFTDFVLNEKAGNK